MMKNRPILSVKSKQAQQGAVLLEALIAILIFSFGLLAISGLQGAMMKNTADATFRSEAAYVVQQQLGAMLSNPIGLGGNNAMPVSNLPGGLLTTRLLSDGRFQFLVTWQVPGEPVRSYEAVTSIFTAR